MKPKQILLLSDCKRHAPVTEPTEFYKVYGGRMFSTARNAINGCKLDEEIQTDYCVVSAKYGLLWGELKIENYRQRITVIEGEKLRPQVCEDFVSMWDAYTEQGGVKTLFVSLSAQHHIALPLAWIARVVGESAEIVVAHGGIGSRQGQLKSFLCGKEAVTAKPVKSFKENGGKEFTFKGVKYVFEKVRAEEMIREGLKTDLFNSRPTTWYCEVDGTKISCKYAVLCLVGHDTLLNTFTTQRAVQMLGCAGIECLRLDL